MKKTALLFALMAMLLAGARLPQAEQDSLAAALLAKEELRNFITFENNTVLPKDGKGMVHMASFNFVYKLSPVCEWPFNQSK